MHGVTKKRSSTYNDSTATLALELALSPGRPKTYSTSASAGSLFFTRSGTTVGTSSPCAYSVLTGETKVSSAHITVAPPSGVAVRTLSIRYEPCPPHPKRMSNPFVSNKVSAVTFHYLNRGHVYGHAYGPTASFTFLSSTLALRYHRFL